MKYLFLILFLSFSVNAYADSYAVQRDDGGVTLVHYIEGSSDSLADVLTELGLMGKPIIRIEESDLPPRSDRDYWEFNDVPIGKKLRVNTAKKAAKEAEKNDRRAKRTSARNKICPACSDQDWEDFFIDP